MNPIDLGHELSSRWDVNLSEARITVTVKTFPVNITSLDY